MSDSHNSKCYAKRIHNKDAAGTKSIKSFWANKTFIPACSTAIETRSNDPSLSSEVSESSTHTPPTCDVDVDNCSIYMYIMKLFVCFKTINKQVLFYSSNGICFSQNL